MQGRRSGRDFLLEGGKEKNEEGRCTNEKIQGEENALTWEGGKGGNNLAKIKTQKRV